MNIDTAGPRSSAVLECRMYLYIYEGYEGGPDRQKKTEALVVRAAEMFIREKNLPVNGASMEIFREEKGKPVFTELPVNFSVSHTGNLWVCLLSEGDSPVGVDVQNIRKARMERIMEWYFTGDEIEYVSQKGEEAFFQIWTRKEAYAKYTGKGLNKELAKISTLNNDEVIFIDFDIRASVKGSCCVKEKGDLCLRTI